MEYLLATKFFIPPTRLKFVSRSRLIDELESGLHRKLTLVSAPAGYGKTTLLSEFASHLGSTKNKKDKDPIKVAWLSLDQNDTDQVRFLTYLLTALQQAKIGNEPFYQGLLSMLQAPQPPSLEDLITLLINQLAKLNFKFVLILDDYHLITSDTIDKTLSYLLEHLPNQLHLVISSRVDPQLPLARMRAGNQLNELRATDLRFSSPEALAFLNHTMELELTQEDFAAIETRTEGWIAGLQLAAISLQGSQDRSMLIKSFTGSHRLVLDYLIEEVLDQQADYLQNFLIQTSILNRLSGDLCSALTGQENSQQILKNLDRSNLFIVPLDPERRWFRYHHLFGDLLRQRLKSTQPETLVTLHKRACEWFSQAGLPDEAIYHALQSNDLDQAVSMIEEQADLTWEQGQHPRLWQWLKKLPENVLEERPDLCIYQAWKQFTVGEQESAEQTLKLAESALEPGSAHNEHVQFSGLSKQRILGRAAVVRAYMAFHRGDIAGTNAFSRQALEILDRSDRSWRSTALVALGDAYNISGDLTSAYNVRLEAFQVSKITGNNYGILLAGMKLALTLRWLGQLQQLQILCEELAILADENGLSEIMEAGLLSAAWGEILAEINELEEALVKVEKGVNLAKRGREIGITGWAYLAIIRVLFSCGDQSGMEEMIEELRNFILEFPAPQWVTYRLDSWRVKLWLLQDRIESAVEWANQLGLEIDAKLTYQNQRDYIGYSRILIAQGQFDQAAKLLPRLLEAAKNSGNRSREIEIMILQALLSQARGEHQQALDSLSQAFSIAEPVGYFRTFVDEGPPMAKLLRLAYQHEVHPEYTLRLIKAFDSDTHQTQHLGHAYAEQDFPPEKLTNREVEVIRLIAAGYTNKEIAVELVLSMNTVKVHTRNIFSKLEVTNRIQATSKALALGIIEREDTA